MYEYDNIEIDEELNEDQMKERIDELFSILEEAKSMVEKIKQQKHTFENEEQLEDDTKNS